MNEDTNLEDLLEFEGLPLDDQQGNDPLDDTSPDDSEDDTELEDDTQDSSTEQEDDSTDGSDPEEKSIHAKFFEIFKDAEIIKTSDDFNFDGSLSSFEEALAQTKDIQQKQIAEDIINSFPPEFKDFASYVLNGGTSVKDFLNLYKDEEDVQSIEPDSIENQRSILYAYYKATTNYNDDKIDRLISRLEASDSLAEEAIDAKEELKEIYKEKRTQLELERDNKAKELEQNFQKFKSDITKAVSELDQIPTTRKGKVQAFLLNMSQRDSSIDTDFNRTLKLISTNPTHIAQLADILLDYDPQKGINQDRLLKKQKTAAVSDLRKKLETIASSPSAHSNQARGKSKENFDWEIFITQQE